MIIIASTKINTYSNDRLKQHHWLNDSGNAECLRAAVMRITVHLLGESSSCQCSVQLNISARQLYKSHNHVSKLSRQGSDTAPRHAANNRAKTCSKISNTDALWSVQSIEPAHHLCYSYEVIANNLLCATNAFAKCKYAVSTERWLLNALFKSYQHSKRCIVVDLRVKH